MLARLSAAMGDAARLIADLESRKEVEKRMKGKLVFMSLKKVRQIQTALEALLESKDLTAAERVTASRIQRSLDKAQRARAIRAWIPENVLRDARDVLVDHFWHHRS